MDLNVNNPQSLLGVKTEFEILDIETKEPGLVEENTLIKNVYTR